MDNTFLFYVCIFIPIVTSSHKFNDDKPCWARSIANRSIVCVCTEEYCDEISRVDVNHGWYMAYTSSEAGSRFKKSTARLENYTPLPLGATCYESILELNPKLRNQTVEGFGGAVTDAASINWISLSSEKLKQHLINSYYSDKGLEYNLMRVPIGGCDFSTYPYAYNEYPENDAKLSNFSLSYEDFAYKLPMIQAAFAVATSDIQIVASSWSPPIWMKTNHDISGISRLKPEYFDTYALYHIKFIEAYKEQGIPIWALTTTNEPINGVMGQAPFNTLGWTSGDMGKYIQDNLGPTLRNSIHKDVKILAVDDQRFLIPLWLNMALWSAPGAIDYIDGIAVHFYFDEYVPSGILVDAKEQFPDKFIISTEACAGANSWDNPKVDLGSWKRAEKYAADIIDDLNHDVVGWIDWNVCLDQEGGPNWIKNFVDSPIIVFPDDLQFVKQPLFYIMGQFSKFIPRGSMRIEVTELCENSIQNVAFLTPRNTIVVVVFNDKYEERIVTLKLRHRQARLRVEAKSIVTAELLNE